MKCGIVGITPCFIGSFLIIPLVVCVSELQVLKSGHSSGYNELHKEEIYRMDFNYVALGRNIRKFRKAVKLTQSQLAEMVDCSDSHIGQIENARGIPSLATVAAIANALDVGVDQLIHEDLNNHTDYFIQELVQLTNTFQTKDKLFTMKMMKALIQVLKDYKT